MSGEEVQHQVLRRHAGRQAAMELDAKSPGHCQAHEPGDHRARYVRRPDAEREAAERAAMRRVRVGADHELAGQRVVLRYHRVANPFRAFARGQVAVIAQAMRAREVLMRLRQIAHEG
jgi:hypothetical protein